MKFRFPSLGARGYVIVVLLLAAVAAGLSSPYWGPRLASKIETRFTNSTAKAATVAEGDEDLHTDDDHAAHDHAGHDAANSLQLSSQARRNIGLKVGRVETSDFQRSITVPAVVVERPGRTRVRVAAPLTGVITDIFAVGGEAVEPDETLFVLRLTHEDLVQAQTEFLKTLEAVDVENREITRLESITEGVVAGRVVLERKYEKQKLEGLLRAQREALLLHGLSQRQVEHIEAERRLVRELQVVVPHVHDETDEQHLQRHHPSLLGVSHPGGDEEDSADTGTKPAAPIILQDLRVRKGDFVKAGATLANLEDLESLYIEGRAFEQDAAQIAEAARLDRQVTALPEDTLRKVKPVRGLDIAYLSNEVQADSRALHFYVNLPNEVIRDTTADSGQRFLTWRFKLGQRMRLRVPVETWNDEIVLPIEAIADEGAETYAFVQNGDHFDRRAVHVKYRDQRHAVIANDGSLLSGETVALNSAHQLQMALKNKADDGVDPHAGHSH